MVCGSPELDNATPKTLLNPSVEVEVLSKSNTSREIISKLKFYRAIASLTDALLVDSESMMVMHLELAQEGDWLTRSWTKAEETIKIVAHDLELGLSEIYCDVEFPSPIA